MIPTAEEWLKHFKENAYPGTPISECMIEFARNHVIAALEAASGKVQLSPELYDFVSDSWESGQWFDKKSILTAYPLDNIK